MKIDMTKLRWVLLGLYAVIVLGLAGIAFTKGSGDERFLTLGVLLATVLSQAVFVFCSGTINLCRPIRKRRAFLPVVLAAFLLTVLVVASLVCLLELIDSGGEADWFVWVFWMLVGINWGGWSIAFLVTYTEHDRYTFARKLLSALLGGSLLELLIAIPSHVIVSRRPGCFVGIMTGLGVGSGIAVMLWAFGPGIILLFLRERYRRESKQRIHPKGPEATSESTLSDEPSS